MCINPSSHFTLEDTTVYTQNYVQLYLSCRLTAMYINFLTILTVAHFRVRYTASITFQKCRRLARAYTLTRTIFHNIPTSFSLPGFANAFIESFITRYFISRISKSIPKVVSCNLNNDTTDIQSEQSFNQINKN